MIDVAIFDMRCVEEKKFGDYVEMLFNIQFSFKKILIFSLIITSSRIL